MMLGATRNKAQILSSVSPTPSLHLLNPRIRTQQAHDDNARPPQALSRGPATYH